MACSAATGGEPSRQHPVRDPMDPGWEVCRLLNAITLSLGVCVGQPGPIRLPLVGLWVLFVKGASGPVNSGCCRWRLQRLGKQLAWPNRYTLLTGEIEAQGRAVTCPGPCGSVSDTGGCQGEMGFRTGDRCGQRFASGHPPCDRWTVPRGLSGLGGLQRWTNGHGWGRGLGWSRAECG